VSGFSNDGQWWWDGQRWIPTAQLVLPSFSTDDERERKVNKAMKRYKWIGQASLVESLALGGDRIGPLLSMALVLPFLFLQGSTFREYRQWILDQVGQATTYLFGASEPMLAGETSIYPSLIVGGGVKGEHAVAVTAAHVLVVRIDNLSGRPRSVELAARSADVSIELSSGPIGYPALTVRYGSGVWPIRGLRKVFQPEPLLRAWRDAAARGAGM